VVITVMGFLKNKSDIFISKNQLGLQRSDPLKSSPGNHSLLVSDSVEWETRICARANARAKFWTPLAQNPGSAPERGYNPTSVWNSINIQLGLVDIHVYHFNLQCSEACQQIGFALATATPNINNCIQLLPVLVEHALQIWDLKNINALEAVQEICLQGLHQETVCELQSVQWHFTNYEHSTDSAL